MADNHNPESNNPRRVTPRGGQSSPRKGQPSPREGQARSVGGGQNHSAPEAGRPMRASSPRQVGKVSAQQLGPRAQRAAGPRVQGAAGSQAQQRPRAQQPARGGQAPQQPARASQQASGRAVRPASGAANARPMQQAAPSDMRSARARQGQPVRPASPRANQQPMRPAGQGQPVRPVNPGANRPRALSRSSSQAESARFAGKAPRVPQSPGPSVSQQSSEPPKKGGGVWRVVFWIALLVFVVSAGALAYIGYTYWKGQAAYDEIANEAFVMPENATLADFDVDWEALRAINPDVVGWIYMPGTDINYPIAHRAGDDEYYLYHNFNGASSAQFGAEYGSIMLSGVNTADFSDEVNIIYGHNMNNGTMFAPLSNMEEDWFNTYRTVYLLTPQGNYLLKSFAYVHVPGSSTDIVIPTFGSSSERTAYMQARYDTSLFTADPAGSPAADIEQAFALVTCDGANRSYRYITYFEPIDYYALDGSTSSGSHAPGTDAGSADSVVSRDDLSNVGGASDERVE